MNILTKPHLSRRTVLRGLGATVSLPLLEAMAPRGFAATSTPAAPVRMAFLFMPNGINPHHWTPEGTGKDYKLSSTLKPLDPFRPDITVLSELQNKASHTGDGHYVKCAGWLTGTTITKTTGEDLRSGNTSIDQLAAQRAGKETLLPSIELGTEPVTTGIDTNVNYTRLYGSHIAWSSPTTPIPCEINPRSAFERLFRKQNTAGKRADDHRSILDYILDDANALRGKIGKSDQQKLDQYLESVRSVESRIEQEEKGLRAGENSDPASQKALDELNARINKAYGTDNLERQLGSMPRFDTTEHVRLMMDIMVLAFWTDATRIGTFMFGNAVSGKNFSFLDGVNGGHHEISHHANKEDQLEQFRRINLWHVQQYAYMLEKMRAIEEGESNLLHNSMLLFGSGFRDGNAHDPRNLPLVLGGHAGGRIAAGQHLASEQNTPLCNLYVSMMKHFGTPVEKFADSTGELAGL